MPKDLKCSEEESSQCIPQPLVSILCIFPSKEKKKKKDNGQTRRNLGRKQVIKPVGDLRNGNELEKK